MATETLTELELFHRFLGDQLAKGHKKMTAQESVEKFAAYQRDVEKLKEFLQPAIEQVQRGEYGPIDWNELKGRVRRRLSDEGITAEDGPNA